MFGKHRIATALWLSIFMFAHASFFWGGVANTPGIGPPTYTDAVLHSPLTRAYMWFGEQVVRQVAPLGGPSFAESHAGQLYPEIEKDPAGASTRIIRGMGLLLQVTHFGAP